ncbi:hypothetical protein NIES2109_61880 (plasmid) [Nostoc sp. HK-01]|nr:hypothetical protein NIES2109_61880 [Nostoc sp. HK-01]
MTEIKLGLGNPPYPIYLYVNKLEIEGQVYGWYNYNSTLDKKIPVIHKSLTGYICELKLTDKEFKGKDNLKLDIVVCADELYVIRSGIETNFSKSFLLAASLIEDFSKPLQIVANPGDDNVVFCSLHDATTKGRIRYQWNPSADWGSIIESIQSKLGSPKYDLDFSEEAVTFPTTKPQLSAPSKSDAIHPHDKRVKDVRILTNYPIDLVKEWLQFQDVKAPNQLPVAQVDRLVRDICLSWAADKIDPNHAASSYQQQVLSAFVEDFARAASPTGEGIASGTTEIQAIQAWMNYVLGQKMLNTNDSTMPSATAMRA